MRVWSVTVLQPAHPHFCSELFVPGHHTPTRQDSCCSQGEVSGAQSWISTCLLGGGITTPWGLPSAARRLLSDLDPPLGSEQEVWKDGEIQTKYEF